MANKAPLPRPQPRPPPRTDRRPLPRDGSAGWADIKRDTSAPTIGVYWGIVAIAVAAAAWFVEAVIVLFASGNPGTDYILWIVGGFAVVFFGLILGLSRRAADDPRYADRQSQRPPTFADAVEDNVATYTGVIGGREALVQVLTIPVTLAIGATLIGIVFWLVR